METNSKTIDALKGGKSPFKVPEGYFDSLDLTLQQVIDTKGTETKEVRIDSTLSKLKPWIGIAASVAILFTAVLTISRSGAKSAEQARNELPKEIDGIQTELLFTQLEEESIIDYLLTVEE